MKTTRHKYDIIILGAGCSGMLLSFFLSNQKTKHDKKILLIEKNQSYEFDKTWCFWEENSINTFNGCISNAWNNWVLYNNNENILKESENYQYNQIKSIDFFKFVEKIINKDKNFEFIQGVEVTDKCIKKNKISFNKYEIEFGELIDCRFSKENLPNNFVSQIFFGYEIQVKSDTKSEINFELPSIISDLTYDKTSVFFYYIIPDKKNNSFLIQATFISKNNSIDFDKNKIHEYIKNKLKLTDYNVIREEDGLIPQFSISPYYSYLKSKNGGTDHGMVKPSSGYGFLRSCNWAQIRANDLLDIKQKINSQIFYSYIYNFLDTVFLEVFKENPKYTYDLFSAMASKIGGTLYAKFLSEKASLVEILKVIVITPNKLIFIKKALKVLFNN